MTVNERELKGYISTVSFENTFKLRKSYSMHPREK